MILRSKSKGITSLVIAAFCYSLYGPISRLIGESFGAFYQVVCRNILVFLILQIYIRRMNSWKKINKSDIKWFLFMTIPGFVAIVSLFIVYNNIPIGKAIFIFHASHTLFGYFLGFILFKEYLTKSKIIALIFSFIGLILMFRVSDLSESLIYLILAILSGVGCAAWNIISKKLSCKYNSIQILSVDCFFINFFWFTFSFYL